MLDRSAHIQRAAALCSEARSQPLGSRPRTIFILRALAELAAGRGTIDACDEPEIERDAYRRRFGKPVP